MKEKKQTMHKKLYTGREILKDICQHENDELELVGIDNYLAFTLYSTVCEPTSLDVTFEEYKEKLNFYINTFGIPLIDFTGHTNKDVIIIDEPNENINSCKIVDSFNYSDELKEEIKNCLTFMNYENNIRAKYNSEVVDLVHEKMDEYPNIKRFCIVDFNIGIVQRLERRIPSIL